VGAPFPGEDERESYRGAATLVFVAGALAALATAALVLSGVEGLAGSARTAAHRRLESALDEAREHVRERAPGVGPAPIAAALRDPRVIERLRREGVVAASVLDERARPVGEPTRLAPQGALEVEEVLLPLESGGQRLGTLKLAVLSPERAVDDARAEALGRCLAAGGLGLALVVGAAFVGAHLIQRERERSRGARARARLARLGVLAGGLAHELELPLAGIREALALLKEHLPEELPHLDDEPGANELCDSAVEYVGRAEGVVRDFLAYARPEPGPPRVADVAGLVRDWARALAPELAAHGVGLVLEGTAAPASAVVDSSGLKQIVWSLVRNARDAAPRGSAVRLSLTRDGERVRLRVADSGPGVGSSGREVVFEPLVSTKPWGLGLGLAVSRRLAEAMGARLSIVGGPPGAVFEVALRAAPLTIQVDFASSSPFPGWQETS